MKSKSVLAAAVLATLAVGLTAADPVPVAPPVVDSIEIKYMSGGLPLTQVYQEPSGTYVVMVVAEYVAAGDRTVTAAVYDENLAAWRWMTAAPQNRAVVSVGTGQGLVTFHYPVVDGDWWDYIAGNPRDLAFVQVTISAGETPKASDSNWVHKP